MLDDLHWERADPSAARVAFLGDRRPPFSPRLTSLSFRKKKCVSKTKTKKTKKAKEAVSRRPVPATRDPIKAAMASTSRNDGGMPPPLTDPKQTCLLPEPCLSSRPVGPRLSTTPREREPSQEKITKGQIQLALSFFFPLSSTTTVRCTYYIQISIYAGSPRQAARSAVNSTTPCCFRLLRSPRCLSSLPRQQSRKRGFVGRDIPPGDRQRYYGGTMTGWANGWGTLPRERLFSLLSGHHASLPAARRRRLFQNPRASSFFSFFSLF